MSTWKASFEEDALRENFQTLIDAINKSKTKHTERSVYLRSVTISSYYGTGRKTESGKTGLIQVCKGEQRPLYREIGMAVFLAEII